MRFRIPQEGEYRERTFFALLPRFSDQSWRWLTRVTVVQRYGRYPTRGCYVECWRMVRFADEAPGVQERIDKGENLRPPFSRRSP